MPIANRPRQIIVEVTGITVGPRGDSAYKVWLDAGNAGTEQDFLDSLEGLPGPSIAGEPGKPGASAYDIWIGEGNTGSEQDFLDDLEGEAGPAGPVVLSNASALKNPEFTYTGSKLTRVDYESGAFKDLEYSAEGVLDTLLYNNNGLLINKQFVYNSQGQLTSIVET